MSGKGAKIHTFVFHVSPDLEPGFLAALFRYDQERGSCTIRRRLGITTGKIKFVFQPSNKNAASSNKLSDMVCNGKPISSRALLSQIDYQNGLWHFDTGGRGKDHHDLIKDDETPDKCSLDLILDEYDFLASRPWLVSPYEYVRSNDLSGERISNHRNNLRELSVALNTCYPNDPQLVIEWLALAFCGIFERSKAGVDNKLFNPKIFTAGVKTFAPRELAWFKQLMEQAKRTIEDETEIARQAVQRAIKAGWTRKVFMPAAGREVHIISVFGDSEKIGPMSRKKGLVTENRGYDVCIQWRSNGNCGIFSSYIRERGTNQQIHFSQLARRLRLLEARFLGVRIKSGQNWAKRYYVLDENGKEIPWYLPESQTAVLNGSRTTRNIPPTKIIPFRLLREVCDVLPKCPLKDK